MNELSVIIAFRNENIEVERTILEIKHTAGNSVDIILVNDASEDNYNYASIYCCRCKAWDYEKKEEAATTPAYGAYFNLHNPPK
jgi:hypothetical protein